MCNKTYNGYTNYETWNVSLWIDNDQGTYFTVQDIAQECYDNAEDSSDYGFFVSKDDNAIRELESRLKDFIEEMNPLNDEANMFSDLLGSAIDNVDWREIAENWIDNIKEEAE